MPCYTIYTIYAKLSVADKETLKRAAHRAGVRMDGAYVYSERGTRAIAQLMGDELTIYDSAYRDLGQQLTRAYSEQTVMETAVRFGWDVQQTGDNQFELSKVGI